MNTLETVSFKNKVGIALNEDSSHFFTSRAGSELSPAAVDAWVDQYANTQVAHLLLNPNSMRTSYASRVWDPIWRGYDPAGPDDQPLLSSLSPAGRIGARKWVHTAWALDQVGIDIYARWIAAARRQGMTTWLSMRMNDLHNVDNEQNYMHSEFWREHPELRRVPYRFTEWSDRAFDYGQEEVCDYHFRLIEELVQRYDFDGLELDWMRFGFHFRPGQEAAGVELLTAFTARVRRLLDTWATRRGHRIRLGARVPSRPETAVGLGMDAVAWAQAGLIDWLVVTPFWATIETDMPIELWRTLLAGTGVELCAGLELLLRPYPGSTLLQTNSLATVRAAALSLLHRGADRLYLFNYMDSETTLSQAEDYPRLLQEIGDPVAMASQPRRHVLTYADTWAVGEAPAIPLPAQVPAGGWRAYRLHIGPQPMQGDCRVILALDPACGATGTALGVRLNGEACDDAEAVTLAKPCPAEPVWSYRVPARAVQSGYNIVEIAAKSAVTVTWVELNIGGTVS